MSKNQEDEGMRQDPRVEDVLAAMERVVSEVTQAMPGRWYQGPYYRTDVESGHGRVAETKLGTPAGVTVAAYIATFDPPTLTKLLAVVRAAQELLDEHDAPVPDYSYRHVVRQRVRDALTALLSEPT